MKQLNQTKLTTKKILLLIGILVAGFQVRAQTHKVGDNLGNHLATQDLDLGIHNIVNASGVVIGAATFTNTNISLELVGSNKAFLVNKVIDVTTNTIPTANAVDGMMVYSKADNRFYFRNNGVWETFASSTNTILSINPDVIGSHPNANGLTLLTTSGNVVLNLEAATAAFPGVVTIGTQTFGGDKTFAGAVNISGSATISSGTSSLLSLPFVSGSSDYTDKVLVIDNSGIVRTSTLTAGLIMKVLAVVPTGTCPVAPGLSNMSYTFIVDAAGVSIDDGVIVNFQNDDASFFKGLTIKSARVSAIGKVTIELEDNQNPTNVGYSFPQFDSKRLIVTYLHKAL